MLILKILSIGLLILGIMWVGWSTLRGYFYAWYMDMPQPNYWIAVDKNIKIPMKDGIKLAADIYRPRCKDKSPVIILRTPYNKHNRAHGYAQMGEVFAGQGYVFIVQDVRGKYQSEGEFVPYLHEASDGFETIEWAGQASWSNGRVALFGFSYQGSCAWLAAATKSRYLRTIIPLFTTQNTYAFWFDKGVPFLNDMLVWFSTYCGKESQAISKENLEVSLKKLPVSELDNYLNHHPVKTYKEYLSHLTPDLYWFKRSMNEPLELLDLPGFLVGGWYDPFVQNTLDDFNRLMNSPSSSKNRQSMVVIGPWLHNPLQELPEIDVGKKGNFLVQFSSILQWCNRWLKEDKISDPSFKIKYFMMGKNEWLESNQWPPAQVAYHKYFLSSTEKDHLLATSLQPDSQRSFYIYHPDDPVSSLGSPIIYAKGLEGAQEQSSLTAREDVITFLSEPLKEEVMIAGPAKVVLYLSSTALDTDFCAKIADLHPDGKAYYIQSGFMRMRFRESWPDSSLIEPGKIYRIEISLRSTAHAFLKNHRIQLQITSSDFPRYDRNLNTGENSEWSTNFKQAEQTIYQGGQYDSYLSLPILQH